MPAARWSEKDVKIAQAKLNKPVPQKAAPKVSPAQRRSKYKNERVEIDGIWFDSQKEGAYYQRLKLEKSAGKVSWFLIKPVFHLKGGIKYVADFLVVRDDSLVMGSTVQVIDVKGMETDVFKLKKKLMLAQGIEILLQ